MSFLDPPYKGTLKKGPPKFNENCPINGGPGAVQREAQGHGPSDAFAKFSHTGPGLRIPSVDDDDDDDIYIYIYIYIYLFIYLFIYIFIYLFIYLFTYP